ncbi:MAG: FlgO family outer membrane protein [Lamprobacter sp.]|uniref:FlgO family outer membrane protein n=1 Tax=Lamprobacter sp. TaxID=3100796 RepID=UPI002B263855|nr:FlgO family outer membrane protein [Lamprobacter sp.]MEA3640451.1 FlgO family outer membrane protein [Lamprobacter sp.]
MSFWSAPHARHARANDPASLSAEITAAANRLVSVNPQLQHYTPMIAATFVDINDLRASSTFGRMSSELFASALSQAGIQMREVKMRDSLFVEAKLGELILTREIKRLNEAYSANSILIGTYAVGSNQVYMSVRVVKSADALVLATADFSLPLNNNLRTMLGERGW